MPRGLGHLHAHAAARGVFLHGAPGDLLGLGRAAAQHERARVGGQRGLVLRVARERLLVQHDRVVHAPALHAVVAAGGPRDRVRRAHVGARHQRLHLAAQRRVDAVEPVLHHLARVVRVTLRRVQRVRALGEVLEHAAARVARQVAVARGVVALLRLAVQLLDRASVVGRQDGVHLVRQLVQHRVVAVEDRALHVLDARHGVVAAAAANVVPQARVVVDALVAQRVQVGALRQLHPQWLDVVGRAALHEHGQERLPRCHRQRHALLVPRREGSPVGHELLDARQVRQRGGGEPGLVAGAVHVHGEALRLERLRQHRVCAAVLGAGAQRREAAVARLGEAPVLEVERGQPHARVGPARVREDHRAVARARRGALAQAEQRIRAREHAPAGRVGERVRVGRHELRVVLARVAVAEQVVRGVVVRRQAHGPLRGRDRLVRAAQPDQRLGERHQHVGVRVGVQRLLQRGE